MKVKIKSLDIQDIRLFDTVYAYAEIKICGIDELWTVDEYIPAVNRPKLAETDSLDQLKHYLDTNPGRKVIFLDHGESMLTSVRFYIEPNGLLPYCESRRLAIIGSGDFPKDWLWTNLDIYLEITASTYNTLVSLNSIEQIYNKKPKPYKFLFLNNKRRDYRTQLIELLKNKNLLDSSLWTYVAEGRLLPTEYHDMYTGADHERWINNTKYQFVFPLGMINQQLHVDTYFNIMVETNFSEPYQFFTEKIYKSLLIGQPFIAVAYQGFYQDLKDKGYRTFDGLIDESFDTIEDDNLRLIKIAESIEELCSRDLDQFLLDAKDICLHNQRVCLEHAGRYQLTAFNSLTIFLKELNA